MFQAALIAPYKKIRKSTSKTYSERNTNGTATAAINAAPATSGPAKAALDTASPAQQACDALREGYEHDDEHDERDEILKRCRHIAHAERFGERERERAECDPYERIEPTEHDDAERL